MEFEEKIEGLGYLEENRTRSQFLTNKFNKSKSNNTIASCNNAFTSFDKFVFTKFGKDSTEDVINDIKKLPEKRHESIMINMFQKYLEWKHKESKASTARSYYQIILEYFSYNQLTVNRYNLKRGLVLLPQDPKDMKYPVSISEIRKLIDYAKPKRKALYTVLTSSGMRIRETLGLRKRDFDFSQNRIMITIPAVLTKRKIERQTYISKEAESYLMPIINKINQDQLVFTSNNNLEQATDNEILNFWHLRKKVELDFKYSNSRTHKITLHSFRAYFETQASNTHGLEYAHALIGHSRYLDQYYRLDDEDRLEKYIELEPKLTISEDFRNKLKIRKLEDKNSELEATKERLRVVEEESKNRNDELEKRIKMLEDSRRIK